MPIINVIPDPIVLPTKEALLEENKRLQEELDTWKKAYARAENESRRFQEEYEKMYHKYMVLKNEIENVPAPRCIHNAVSALKDNGCDLFIHCPHMDNQQNCDEYKF